MELAKNNYYVMRLKDAVIDLEWLPATQDMNDEAFKAALKVYANLSVEHEATGLLVDIRQFGHMPGSAVGPWRTEQIIPRYNEAGVKRFAYVMPPGAALPPPAKGGSDNPAGEDFDTRFFDDPDAARDWVAGG